MRHNIRRMVTAVSAAFLTGLALTDEAPEPPVPFPILYQGFNRGGDAWLRGGLSYRFELDETSVALTPRGAAYRFEPPYTNVLAANQASPEPAGFLPGEGVKLTIVKGYGSASGLAAAGSGALWRTVPVELTGLKSPHRDTIAFIGSVYLRSATPGVKVRLTVLDLLAESPWREPIQAANAAVIDKDPEAKGKPPFETVSRPGELALTAEWQRVTASITLDVRRPVSSLALALEAIPDQDGGPPPTVDVVASALQLEPFQRYPDNKDFAGPWIPGGESAGGNALTVPLRVVPLDPNAGTLACRVRLPPPEGGGHAGGVLMALGGGWWRPVWTLGIGRCYAGDAGREKYTIGQSILRVPGASRKRLRDGGWHRLAMTWANDTMLLYLDGEEIARAAYFPAAPPPNGPLRIGGSTLDGGTASAELAEVSVWDRALSPGELAALDAAAPMHERLPAAWLARPERLVYHRGEASAILPLDVRMPPETPPPAQARLTVPALGVDEWVRFASDRPITNVTIHPWRASPGRHRFHLRSDEGALAVESTIEIVEALPPTDFYMLGWTGSPAVAEHGFTAELAHANELETTLRRGMLASLRFDARKWHPLEPETLAASLASARATARRAAAYPNIVASMLNTEVGIGKPPAEPWFATWMKRETGLDAIPDEVKLGPLRIVSPPDAPPIVPADDPAWRYARWLTGEGKGWPELNARIAAAMREQGLDQGLFYTDQPQSTVDVRGLDMVDYWHYPHVSSGLVTGFNRVCNIARLAGKRLSLMPGTIYHDPWPFRIDGKVVCLSSDTMRQYLWITVANPLDHLGLYGFGELEKGFVPPGLAETITQTTGQLLPVGILTGGLPAPSARVAYLHTSGQWWKGPGDNRWIEWWFNRMATRALAEARLRFDWIGDEHVEAGWLDRYDAVVVLGAWRIPAPIHQALADFAAGGGKLVVDTRYRTPPEGATVLELTAKRHPRAASPESAAALQAWAQDFQTREPDACRLRDTDQAWVFEKIDGDARHVFVVNDLAEPGLLGKDHGLRTNLGTSTGPLPDRGLAQTVALTLPPAGAVYDVRRHRRLDAQNGAVELELPPGDAAVLALAPETIENLRVATPQAIPPGESATLRIEVLNERGNRISHRNLIEIRAIDAAGKAVDVHRYHRVNDGLLDLALRLPLDIAPGKLRLEITEWLAGLTTTRRINVMPIQVPAAHPDHPL